MFNVASLFTKWLIEEMRSRGWSQAELVRRSGISAANISNLLSGARNPGKDSCARIAAALKLPVEEVYRQAGLIPPDPEKDERIYKIENLYHTLREDSNKDRALQFLEFLSELEEKNDRIGKKPKRDA